MAREVWQSSQQCGEQNVAVPVELYSDFACPFCYLAEAGARRLEEAGHAVAYKSYELRPAPVPLEAPGADPMKVRGWELAISPAAAELGLEMRFPTIAIRTRKAHEAARHARQLGMERAMRDALFAAYFGEGRDIGRIDVLVEIGASLGMDLTELKVTLDIDQHTDAVRAEEAEAARLGLSGVPAYVGNENASPRVVVGLQDYARLLAWVEKAQ
jgi:predicted DsbA family dithiol-disulfide isomerase